MQVRIKFWSTKPEEQILSADQTSSRYKEHHSHSNINPEGQIFEGKIFISQNRLQTTIVEKHDVSF